jgi:pyroglutamyl-peptidase
LRSIRATGLPYNEAEMSAGPKLLATGFGPFPGAPENPTAALIAGLAGLPAEALGGSALRAVVLPTDYRRSWEMLCDLYAGFAPDVVVHFGLDIHAEAIQVERIGRNAVDPMKRDAAGYAPPDGRVHLAGPDLLHATLPVSSIVDALTEAGHAAMLSDDAGGYVCNATLYRSLHAEAAPQVGFIHVPPEKASGAMQQKLVAVASIVLQATIACSEKSR